jgi:hypothetical protein
VIDMGDDGNVANLHAVLTLRRRPGMVRRTLRR